MAKESSMKITDATKSGSGSKSPDANNIGTPLKGPSVNSDPTRKSVGQGPKTLGPRVA
jgi:hypothetical protein